MRNSLPPQPLQAGHSSLPQRRLESAAARRSGSTVAAGAGATPAAFYLGLCRLRGILPLPASHDHAAGGPFFFAAAKIGNGHGMSLLPRQLQAGHSFLRNEDWNRMRKIVVASVVAGGPFFSAATKIRFGRGKSLSLSQLQSEPCSDSQIWA